MEVEQAGYIVFDIVDEEVVSNNICYENSHNSYHATQTIFETWKVALPEEELIPTGPDEQERILKCVDGALSIINGSLAIGCLVTPPPVNIACGILAGMGGLLQTALKLIPGKPDPMKEKLAMLTKKMQELEKKIQEGFDDMKEFITEYKFYEEIINEVSTMKKLLNDCLIQRTTDSYENFRVVYKRKSVLDMAYAMGSLLDHKSTNPLIMAMLQGNNRPEAFKKWKKIILTIIGDLKLIESFACGLFKNKNLFDCERLIEQEAEINESFKKWRKEYLDDYWKEMQTYLDEVVVVNDSWTNAQRADEIVKKLRTYQTYDSFYVCVFDESVYTLDFLYTCPEIHEQIIGCWNINRHNIFVYRSFEANNKSHEDYETIIKEVDSCRNEQLIYDDDLDTVVQQFFMKIKSEHGFIGLFVKSRGVQIRSTNSNGREWGPGWWREVELKEASSGAKLSFYVIASFK